MEKTYRCGYCGTPTDEGGTPVSLEKCKELTDEQLNSAELVHGWCCYEEQQDNRVVVTRDMALDACDPSLEGQIINW